VNAATLAFVGEGDTSSHRPRERCAAGYFPKLSTWRGVPEAEGGAYALSKVAYRPARDNSR
jgi:hypothetical protein